VALFVRSTGMTTFELTAATSGFPAQGHRWTGSAWATLGTVSTETALRTPSALSFFGGRNILAFLLESRAVRELDAAGSWSPLRGPGIDDRVHVVLATATDVVIGGSFTSISGVALNGIARGRSGAWQPLGSGVGGGPVYAVVKLPNGDLIAGGDFTTAGGIAANRVARWDGTAWTALGAGITGGHVSSLLVLADGSLIAAGGFQQAGGQNANRIARWNGISWSPLGSGLNDGVNALVQLHNGDVVAGGAFTTAGGAPIASIARWNGATWSSLTAGGPNAVVSALALLPNGTLLVGGFFSQLGFMNSPHLAKWTSSSGWMPVAGYTYAPFSYVDVMVALPDGDVLVAGDSRLPSAGVFPARFDGQTLAPLPTAPTTIVAGAWTPAGEALLAGEFATIGGVTSGYLARLVTPCVAAAAPYGAGCVGSGGMDVLTASELGWAGGTFRGLATGLPASAAAAAVFGISQISVPLSNLLSQGLPGCNVVTTLDLVAALVPSQGRVATQLPIPAVAGLVGQVLHHQVITVETAGSSLIAATSTNGLRLTIGMF
jgi:hypothetical protein